MISQYGSLSTELSQRRLLLVLAQLTGTPWECLLHGVSAGPPGGLELAVASNFKSYGEIVSHQVSKNLSAEVVIAPKQSISACSGRSSLH